MGDGDEAAPRHDVPKGRPQRLRHRRGPPGPLPRVGPGGLRRSWCACTAGARPRTCTRSWAPPAGHPSRARPRPAEPWRLRRARHQRRLRSGGHRRDHRRRCWTSSASAGRRSSGRRSAASTSITWRRRIPTRVAAIALIDVGHRLEPEGVRKIVDFMARARVVRARSTRRPPRSPSTSRSGARCGPRASVATCGSGPTAGGSGSTASAGGSASSRTTPPHPADDLDAFHGGDRGEGRRRSPARCSCCAARRAMSSPTRVPRRCPSSSRAPGWRRSRGPGTLPPATTRAPPSVVIVGFLSPLDWTR